MDIGYMDLAGEPDCLVEAQDGVKRGPEVEAHGSS
jgi:hypothetical protein